MRYANKIFPIVSPIILILALFFGYGILIRPELSISCGAIDLNIPSKLINELLSMKLTMAPENMKNIINKELPKTLTKYGLSHERINQIMHQIEESMEKGSPIDTVLKPNEGKIVEYAIMNLMMENLGPLQEKMNIPDAVLFYEINNRGWIGAKNAHLVIRVNGSIYNHMIDSDNKLSNSEAKVSLLEYDFQNIAPDSKTKGIVWFSRSEKHSNLEENEITVSYEVGTKKRNFNIDNFYLSTEWNDL